MRDFELWFRIVTNCGGILAVVVIFVVLLVARRRRLRAAFDRLARRLGGTVTTQGGLGGPQLEFRVDGVPALLTVRPGAVKLPEWTRLRFSEPGTRRLRVVPRKLSGFEPLRGGVEVSSGEPAFDKHYKVEVDGTGSLLPVWRRLLATAGQLGMDRRIVPGAGLDVGPAGITVTNYSNLMDRPRDLEAFVDTAVDLFREIRGLGHPGVTLSQLQIRPSGMCPVCSHDVGPGGRSCPGCHTAHHADCWEYFGGCSIYACSGGAKAASARPH